MWIDSKDYLFDNELSLGAKGAYALLKELKDQNPSVEKLADNSNTGRTSCRSYVKELIDKNYIKREFVRKEGKVRGIEYKFPDKVLKLANKTNRKFIGFIYLIKKDDEHKIGITQNINNRMLALKRNANKFEVISYAKVEDNISKESELHNKFSSKNTTGEWYILNDEDVEYIKNKFNEWKLDYIK